MTAAGNQIVDFMNRNARTEAQFESANTHKPMASGPNGSVLRPKIFEILGISRAAHIERTAHPAQKTTGILSKWERSKESPESMLINNRVQGSKHNSATKKANATGRFNSPSMTSLFCWGRSPVVESVRLHASSSLKGRLVLQKTNKSVPRGASQQVIRGPKA